MNKRSVKQKIRDLVKHIEVLLIEDNPGDVLLIRNALAQGRFSVRLHVAVDGEQALQMLADQNVKYNLIILDLNIPKIHGLSLLARWQPAPAPVVVFSSSLNEAEIRRALKLGAREFVHKPNGLQPFGEAVSQIIEHWASAEDSTAAS
jgi:CheY-like chemotaxis protein